jgi:hypothetical protein
MPRSSRCEAADTRNTGVPSSQSAPAAASLGPEPVPHPDDVIIDYRTGEVRIDGPVMEEQKAAGEQLKALWPDLERELIEINEQIKSDPNDLSLRKRQKELTKMVRLLRERALKRTLRDALRPTPGKSRKGRQ